MRGTRYRRELRCVINDVCKVRPDEGIVLEDTTHDRAWGIRLYGARNIYWFCIHLEWAGWEVLECFNLGIKMDRRYDPPIMVPEGVFISVRKIEEKDIG